MPSWFDLKSLDPNGPEDEAGIAAAAAMVETLIAAEVTAGVPADRILLGGFSQGGALALHTALHIQHRLAGVAALSCWAPLHRQISSAGPTNREIPFYQAHGDCDPVVPYRWGQMTAQLLKTLLPNHQFKTYKVRLAAEMILENYSNNAIMLDCFLWIALTTKMQGLMHSSNEEEMKDLKQFIETALPPA